MTDTPNTKPSAEASELASRIICIADADGYNYPTCWDKQFADMIDAALARAREEARREALEEALNLAEDKILSCAGGDYKSGGSDTAHAIAREIRALIHPTPQGETKEQQP